MVELNGAQFTARALGIGTWTLYRILKTGKVSRTVTEILKLKGITL